MQQKEILSKKIGIVGGGQLGKMMILEAKKLGLYITVLDPTKDCPAHSIADEHIVANFHDSDALAELAEKSDVVTYELEHIDASALQKIEKKGKQVYPSLSSLSQIQNKWLQKQILHENGIPVPPFIKINTCIDAQQAGELLGYPFLLKSCTGGYDGKGNYVLNSKEDILQAFKVLDGESNPLMAEKFVDFTKEISVLACRGIKGEMAVYPVGENEHKDNILIETSVPASISEQTKKEALQVSQRVMETFCGVGMFCIEMFVLKDHSVCVNEVAPRPHNSGHYTIEGCFTNQFEQHIRAILGIPLGSCQLISPIAMRNILGGATKGIASVTGLEKALEAPAIKVHVYGKETSVPKRKMGHLTARGNTVDEAKALAKAASELIQIDGKII